MLLKKALAAILTGTMLLGSAATGVGAEESDYYVEESVILNADGEHDDTVCAVPDEETELLEEAAEEYYEEETEVSDQALTAEQIPEDDLADYAEEVDEDIFVEETLDTCADGMIPDISGQEDISLAGEGFYWERKYYAGDYPYENAYQEGDFVYTDGTKTTLIGYEGSGGAVDLSGINTLTKIAGWALYGKDNITSVKFPDSLKEIQGISFYGCDNLQSITWGKGIEIIGNSAFMHCPKLTINDSPSLPNTVKEIGENVFYGCELIKEFTFPSSITDACWNSLNGKGIVDHQVLVTVYGSAAVAWARSVNQPVSADFTINGTTLTAYNGPGGTVVIPSCVTSIGDGAFKDKTAVTKVQLSSSVTSIGNNAFSGCSGLTEMDWGSQNTSLKTIGASAFKDCVNLRGLYIPDGVTAIGDYAFAGCTSVTRITLDNSLLTSIGTGAFDRTVKVYAECGPGYVWAKTNVDSYELLYGHKKTVTIPGRAATDTTPGLTEGRKCEVCGDIIQAQKEIPCVAAKPEINMSGASYTGLQKIELTTTTVGAKIYYTLDGKIPTVSDTEYKGIFTIEKSGTIRLNAIAVKEGIENSSIASITFSLQEPVYGMTVTAPTFADVKVGYENPGGQPLKITNTGNIRQKVNKVELSGANPGAFSLSGYVDRVFEIYLKSTDENHVYIYPETGLSPGTYTATVTVTYEDTRTTTTTVSFTVKDAVAPPVFSPASKTQADPFDVTITCPTDGAAIYYTLDGSTPSSANGTRYTGPVTVENSVTIKAIAVKSGSYDSNITEANYTIYDENRVLWVDTIAFNEMVQGDAPPASRGITLRNDSTAFSVTITSVILEETSQSAFTILKSGDESIIGAGQSNNQMYTIQPKEGLSAGTYTATIRVRYNTPQKENVLAFGTVSAAVLPPVTAPSFYPSGGTYPTAQNVSLSGVEGATIYYTLDGTNPTDKSTKYSKAFKVDKTSTTDTITVKAIAVRGNVTSPVATAVYTIKQIYNLSVTAPVFDNAATGYTQPAAKAITIFNSGNSDATISSVKLVGTHAGKFKLNKENGSTIKAQSMDMKTYTIQPVAALPAGTYTASIVVTYNNNATANAYVTFIVQDVVEKPVFEPDEGTYTGELEVKISCSTDKAKIYYSFSTSSSQNTSWQAYTGPIKFRNETKAVTIKAKATKDKLKDSEIVTVAYEIKRGNAITILGEHGTGTASSTFAPEGEEVTLTAKPDEGYRLKNWEVVSGGVTVKDNKFTVGKEDVKIKAVFEKNIYTISAASEIMDAETLDTVDQFGSVSGTGMYGHGDTVMLQAAPGIGFAFRGWKENGQIISTANPLSFSATSNRSFTAVFGVSTVPTVVWVDDDGNPVDFTEYEEGSKVPITSAIPTKEETDTTAYIFDHWEKESVDGIITTYKPVFIEKMKIDDAPVVLSAMTFVYNGKRQNPAVTSLEGFSGLKAGADYVVTYQNSVNPGKYVVKVTGKGNYVGETSAEYRIVKAKNTLKKVTLTWKGVKKAEFKSADLKEKKKTVNLKTKYNDAKGSVKVSYTSSNKRIKVSKKGKVTVNKGLKKGVYSVTVKVTAAGNKLYEAGEGSAVFKIVVK